MYIFGGRYNGTTTNKIFTFNMATETFAELTSGGTPVTLPNAWREGGAAAVGSKIYLFGGRNSGGTVLNAIMTFETTTNAITTLTATMPHGLSVPRCVAVDTIIYIVGGSTGSNGTTYVSYYNTESGTYTETSTLKTPVFGHGVYLSYDGQYIYSAGGYRPTNDTTASPK